MNISIIGRQMTVSDDLKAHVIKKLAKFDKFFDSEAEAYVTFSKIRAKECLEVTISSNGTLFRSEEISDTFMNAMDRCIDSIERQIRKNKTRLERRLREGAFTQLPSDPSDSVAEEGEFIIRTKSFPLKPMTPEEAILQMNLLGHSFFVFKNIENGETCVVYKRNAGSYGLIAPEEP